MARFIDTQLGTENKPSFCYTEADSIAVVATDIHFDQFYGIPGAS
jgi:hypothetical protein